MYASRTDGRRSRCNRSLGRSALARNKPGGNARRHGGDDDDCQSGCVWNSDSAAVGYRNYGAECLSIDGPTYRNVVGALWEFAWKGGIVACPSAPVVTVAMLEPVAVNVPPAPVCGNVKVRITPPTGFLLRS